MRVAAQTEAGFLTQGAENVGPESLSWGRCVLCRMFLRVPAFHLVDVNSTTAPGWPPKCHQTSPNVAWEQKHPRFRAIGIRSGSTHFTDKISYLWEDERPETEMEVFHSLLTHSFTCFIHQAPTMCQTLGMHVSGWGENKNLCPCGSDILVGANDRNK